MIITSAAAKQDRSDLFVNCSADGRQCVIKYLFFCKRVLAFIGSLTCLILPFMFRSGFHFLNEEQRNKARISVPATEAQLVAVWNRCVCVQRAPSMSK